MKKTCLAVLAAMVAGIVSAQTVDQKNLSTTAIGTNAATATAGIRGVVESIRVDVYTAGTSAVSVVTADGMTLFSKADCTGTNWYNVRFPACTYAGTAIVSSSAESNKVWMAPAIVSDVTATFTGSTTTTGAVGVVINYVR